MGLHKSGVSPTREPLKNTFEYEEQGCIKQEQAYAGETQKHL